MVVGAGLASCVKIYRIRDVVIQGQLFLGSAILFSNLKPSILFLPFTLDTSKQPTTKSPRLENSDPTIQLSALEI